MITDVIEWLNAWKSMKVSENSSLLGWIIPRKCLSLFLSQFPLYRNMSANLYKTRREVIPSDPKEKTDLDVNLEWFHYSQNEMFVKWDQVLDDGKRIILFSSNDHLDLLARVKQVLGDGTFKITPKF